MLDYCLNYVPQAQIDSSTVVRPQRNVLDMLASSHHASLEGTAIKFNNVPPHISAFIVASVDLDM